MNARDFRLFEQVIQHTRAYFVLAYHAGTREMIYRYVCSQCGDVPPLMVSAALKILRADGVIIFDKRVWWFLADV